jgi:hypothetical protein
VAAIAFAMFKKVALIMVSGGAVLLAREGAYGSEPFLQCDDAKYIIT